MTPGERDQVDFGDAGHDTDDIVQVAAVAIKEKDGAEHDAGRQILCDKEICRIAVQ